MAHDPERCPECRRKERSMVLALVGDRPPERSWKELLYGIYHWFYKLVFFWR